uniref:Uncharacterized protein n=1 Tax=Timema shepardi TaxID=629360 RepID=A0A7R9B1C1_TIMSH|nr:unnamed protein product [Timema shepardi]
MGPCGIGGEEKCRSLQSVHVEEYAIRSKLLRLRRDVCQSQPSSVRRHATVTGSTSSGIPSVRQPGLGDLTTADASCDLWRITLLRQCPEQPLYAHLQWNDVALLATSYPKPNKNNQLTNCTDTICGRPGFTTTRTNGPSELSHPNQTTNPGILRTALFPTPSNGFYDPKIFIYGGWLSAVYLIYLSFFSMSEVVSPEYQYDAVKMSIYYALSPVAFSLAALLGHPRLRHRAWRMAQFCSVLARADYFHACTSPSFWSSSTTWAPPRRRKSSTPSPSM